ncbi:MAG: methyltransferase family protein [Ignavibacteria bacterium]
MLVIRTIIFTVLVPFNAVFLIPYLLLILWNQKFDIGSLRFAGLILIIAGLIFFLMAVLKFLVEGRGTPAIFFTKRFRFLVGEEPDKMLSSGAYRYSRNPMYVSGVMIVLGEGIFFSSPVLLIYSALLFAWFHFIIVHLEEPHLKKKYGNKYQEYLLKVPRWLRIPFSKEKLEL